MKPATYAEQKSSVLLNKEENEQLFKLLGQKCQTLATTVAQLFATDGPESTTWIKRDVGVLCLVRDTNKRSYFFRLYCLVRNKLVWEHEIYNNMQYLAQRSFLHTFEAEERIVAFNFANENEAAHLRGILLEKLKCKAQRRLDRKNRENSLSNSQIINKAPARPAPAPAPLSNFNSHGNGYLPSKQKPSKLTSSGRGKKFKKKSITKDDIGQPLDFVHVSHVGFDKNVGFKMDNIDDTMRQFFDKAGISENDLKDKKTLEYIYDFIEKHGGYDAVKQNIQQSTPVPISPPPPPPVPARNVPAVPSSGTSIRTAPPPPPTSSQRIMHPAPPPPPSGPPPSNVIIQRNQNQTRKSDITTKTVQANNAPPPPPPPPLPSLVPEKTAVVSQPVSSDEPVIRNSAPDPRSALMEAIRSGKTLKHVETETRKPAGDDSRGELLSQIRQGVELKSVPPVSKPANSSLASNDLATALARALAERAELMHTDSSDSSDTDDSDNEWDE